MSSGKLFLLLYFFISLNLLNSDIISDPILFVENYEDITEELLIKNNNLFEKAINLNRNQLDLNYIYNTNKI